MKSFLISLLGFFSLTTLAADPSSTGSSSAGKRLLDKARCEELPQNNADDLWKLADCYESVGLPMKSVEILRKVSRSKPRDLKAYATAAWLLYLEGNRLGGSEQERKMQEAIEEHKRATVANSTHWEAYMEFGDFYFLRFKPPNAKEALIQYEKARKYYDGDSIRGVPAAELGQKASIENRIARTAERLSRKGDAVEATCRALFFDPDDASAKERLTRLAGSCAKKGVKDPTNQ